MGTQTKKAIFSLKVNSRKEFDKPRFENLLELRRHIVNFLRNNNEARMYFAGSDQEWSRQLDQLEKKGFYENTCGDLMLSALAHNFCVDIFVINTSRGSSLFSPISSSVWGGKQTNKPPLLLVYDGDHFEPLLPATPHDCQLTIELMQSWKTGDFNVTLAGLKTRQGSHSAEQKKKPFEQVSTDSVESAASAGAMQVKNEQTWTTVEKGGQKKKAEFVQVI